MSDSDSGCLAEHCSTSGFGYAYWVGNLDRVGARRGKLLRHMASNLK